MDDLPQPEEPANLKFLRLLVTTLTTVMIVGVIVVIGLLVTRLRDAGPALPDQVTLPAGTGATAFTQGDGWFAVVTDDQRILIYNRLTGALQQEIAITAGE
ncbi:DUF6476 family protein [Lutimaribacter sp. EGI FJ00015]|uniref:DUF6476 family protein n=1 Tax=Lutimaribacter degradans TaxID=2945989 RepID=A0ACC5ZTE4_9RHOB|nr:DUF6476 family protein [Lutimaribacter sp. EGI FJ00013]MCM2561405.1 DUF6476 family protein [Lutimaribacter sp. EGI FJ00013]MCO0612885.1 DUF6476 family protein [Lutimaribacter sp. EGI FJ00015]MCO0635543.1 DUF6476 family protein [Lutimaribacter sp. EGI FJ00014]